MADIKKELNDIKNAVYGREVRGSIHDGIKKINEESEGSRQIANSIEQRQDAVEQQFDDVLNEWTSDKPISNEETIAARTNRNTGENHQTLGQRLDAENRKVNAQLAQIVTNVKSFGAKGDGETDDADAIQNAMDYVANSGGGTVFFPSGEYLISKTLNVNGSNMVFVGKGYSSHIHTTNDVTAFYASGHDNLKWYGLRVTGQQTDNVYGGYGSGVSVNNANNIHVEGCFFENLKAKAVFYTGFSNREGGNVEQGVHDGWVLNNYIDHCGDGIMVYNDGRRIEISGNMIFRCVNIGVYIDDSHQVGGIEIPRESVQVNVENNYIADMYGTTAINFAGTQYSSARGNYIVGGGQTVGKNVNGISIQTVQNHIPSKHNIIEGNTIIGNTNIGIDLIGTSFNIIRNNNLINNSLNRTSGSAASIELRDNTIRDVLFESSGNIIENNKSHVDSAESTLAVHVIIRENCNNNIIRFNKFDGGRASYSIIDNGVGTINEENVFNGQLQAKGFEDGDFKNPSIYFTSDPTTGFFRLENGEVGFAFNGATAMRFRDGIQIMEGRDWQFGTTTGTKIGTSATQKIGFWGRTPVARPENIPQTSGATLAELEQEVNKLKYMLKTIGLMA